MVFNVIRGDKAPDPYPFGLLTMIVSLEAIFLSIFVLVSQNRSGEKDRIRADLDYQVNLKAQAEIMLLHKKLDTLQAAVLGAAQPARRCRAVAETNGTAGDATDHRPRRGRAVGPGGRPRADRGESGEARREVADAVRANARGGLSRCHSRARPSSWKTP